MKKKNSGFTLMELVVVIATVAVLALLPLTALAITKSESRRINCVGNLKRVGLSFRLWAANHGDRYPMRVTFNDGGPNIGNPNGTMASLANAAVWQCFAVMSNELTTPKLLLCPSENYPGKATIPSADFAVYVFTGKNAATSYFIGVDADGAYPSMFLAGDHNMGNGGANDTPPLNNAVYPAFQVLGPPLSINPPAIPTAAWTEGNHQKEGNVCLVDGSVQQLTIARVREALRSTRDPGWNNQYNRTAFPR